MEFEHGRAEGEPLGAHALPDAPRAWSACLCARGLLPAACLATDGDPVPRGSLVRRRSAPGRLDPGPEEVRIQAPGTDITLGVAGRTWIPCVGEHNMPDGEFFTGPVEDAVTEIGLFPASFGGREVAVRLRFEDGKITEASPSAAEAFLLEMLDTDAGARRLGELGVGTNYASPRAPRRSCSARRSAARCTWRSGCRIPRRARPTTRRSIGSEVCDLCQGGSITVDVT